VSRRPAESRDGGFASVFVLGAIAIVLALGMLLLLLAQIRAARTAASGAADLAALAAAAEVFHGERAACEAAERVAAAQRPAAGLVGCTVEGLTVEVRVSVDLPGVLHGLPPPEVRAKAGYATLP